MSDFDKDQRVHRILFELDMKLRKQREDEFRNKPEEVIGHLLGILFVLFLFCHFLHII